MNNGKKIKVLIVDDSSVVRQTMSAIIEETSDLTVVGTAPDPYIAVEKMRTQAPDVITLDVEMPKMDGLTFLKKIMSQHPIPVVMCSSLTEKNCETTMKALEYGAVDIITKPQMGVKQFFEDFKVTICDSIRAAASANLKAKKYASRSPQKKLTADAVLEKPNGKSMLKTTEKIVLVGASTGGTEALRVFLEDLPVDTPGIVIVQHMPEKFTASFAERLNQTCAVNIKEAENNDTVIQGRVLIAPGGFHTLIKRSGARYYVEVKEGPLVSRHRPSVDVLFRSGAKYVGKNAIGVIMTGMGDDGAHGMKEMKDAGAYNIAQDEQSCVVYGMPKEAVKLGAVDMTISLENIAPKIVQLCKQQVAVAAT